MAGFNAAEAVEALDFDLSSFKDSEGKPLPKGTIPEPSREQIDECFEAIRTATKDAGLDLAAVTGDDNAALVAALANADEKALEKVGDAQAAAIAKLCAGTPSREQIDALPYRVQQAFTGWLLGQFSDPTKLNGASRS